MDINNKFLPIGSICTVNGYNKKIMITGYYSIEYTGNVKMFDYSGCDYPEGLLLSNKKCSFNHSEILLIDYLGFINEDYNKLNEILNSQKEDVTKTYEYNSLLSNIKFDENGVVIYDPIVNTYSETNNFTNTPEIKSYDKTIQDISNPFIPTYKVEDSVNTEKQNDSKSWSIFKNIQFDENGVVISAVERTPEELEQI